MLSGVPSADAQLLFLRRIETLLARGRFTSTYKFAMLIALANISVARGDDSNAPLQIDMDDIAREYLSLYWCMARPYPGHATTKILKQNREAMRPSSMIKLLQGVALSSASSYTRLRCHVGVRDTLIQKTRVTLAKDVLYRLQNVDSDDAERSAQSERFLYDHPEGSAECARLDHITLRPGVAACFRALHGVIVALVQARWAEWVRRNNPTVIPADNLEQFLFGADRVNVSQFASRLHELQSGRCFYTGGRLPTPTSGEVDHFIPWARYPENSPFNLVLATRAFNNAQRDNLKSSRHRKLWLARNDKHFKLLVTPAPIGFGALPDDRDMVHRIADWIYGRAV